MSSKNTVGPVLHRLGEDLQQVAVLVAVDQDLASAQLLDRRPYRPDPLHERVVVVRVRRLEELHAARGHLVDGAQDVVGGQGDVLHARPAVELQVLVDLALALAERRLVQRELHLLVAVRDHLAHQRGVLGGDVGADELLHVLEAHHLVVEGDPGVHLAQLHVADDVVDGLEQPLLRRGDQRRPLDEAGQEGAAVGGPLDQGVPRLAVRRDGGRDDLAGLVLGQVRLGQTHGTALDRHVVRPRGVRHAQRDVDDAVAVPRDVVAHGRAGDDRAVTTNRAPPDSRTYSASSADPVSGPR
jgi:hypothetical protein